MTIYQDPDTGEYWDDETGETVEDPNGWATAYNAYNPTETSALGAMNPTAMMGAMGNYAMPPAVPGEIDTRIPTKNFLEAGLEYGAELPTDIGTMNQQGTWFNKYLSWMNDPSVALASGGYDPNWLMPGSGALGGSGGGGGGGGAAALGPLPGTPLYNSFLASGDPILAGMAEDIANGGNAAMIVQQLATPDPTGEAPTPTPEQLEQWQYQANKLWDEKQANDTAMAAQQYALQSQGPGPLSPLQQANADAGYSDPNEVYTADTFQLDPAGQAGLDAANDYSQRQIDYSLAAMERLAPDVRTKLDVPYGGYTPRRATHTLGDPLTNSRAPGATPRVAGLPDEGSGDPTPTYINPSTGAPSPMWGSSPGGAVTTRPGAPAEDDGRMAALTNLFAGQLFGGGTEDDEMGAFARRRGGVRRVDPASIRDPAQARSGPRWYKSENADGQLVNEAGRRMETMRQRAPQLVERQAAVENAIRSRAAQAATTMGRTPRQDQQAARLAYLRQMGLV